MLLPCKPREHKECKREHYGESKQEHSVIGETAKRIHHVFLLRITLASRTLLVDLLNASLIVFPPRFTVLYLTFCNGIRNFQTRPQNFAASAHIAHLR